MGGRLRAATTLALLVIRGQHVQGVWSTARLVGPSPRATMVLASGVRRGNGSTSRPQVGSRIRSPWAKLSSDSDSSHTGDEGTGMRGKIGVVGGRLAALGVSGTVVAAKVAARPLPVVLVHGILDCVDNMYLVEMWVRTALGRQAHVLNVEIGNGIVDSVVRPMSWQLEELASAIRADDQLRDGFNIIGYSQGSLLARAYVQRYNSPRVSTLISWVGPQAGQFGVPEWDELMNHLNKITSPMWYTPAVQERVSFANYWRDPMRLDLYRSASTFLADINNENLRKNSTYKRNLLSLDAMVLVRSAAAKQHSLGAPLPNRPARPWMHPAPPAWRLPAGGIDDRPNHCAA